ncbi:MAG TPA: sensor histidine kinase [Candidatus Dormibacteraeota bacterium]|nr:sensor histidine kinase [Candidatus Dormibacteraeota bacterium]
MIVRRAWSSLAPRGPDGQMPARVISLPGWAWALIDVLVALVLFAVSVSVGGGHEMVAKPPVLLLTGALTLPLAVRRRWPIPVMAVVVAAGCVKVLLGVTPSLQTIDPIPAVAVVYEVARRKDFRVAAPWVGAAIIAMAACSLATSIGHGGNLDLETATFSLVAALAGNRMRLREAQELGARHRAALEERERISRELHDMVGHHLSVISLQAGAALTLTDGRRDDPVRAPVSAIEASSREALREMRRMVTGMRALDTSETASPTADPSDLHALVERVRGTGLPVALIEEGDLRTVPADVARTAHRIVQEALTNVLRHAGPARARVRVAVRGDVLELEVTDTGRGRAASSSPDGHGLIGMRERVGAHGGELEAGPGQEGGFTVRARLPLGPR